MGGVNGPGGPGRIGGLPKNLSRSNKNPVLEKTVRTYTTSSAGQSESPSSTPTAQAKDAVKKTSAPGTSKPTGKPVLPGTRPRGGSTARSGGRQVGSNTTKGSKSNSASANNASSGAPKKPGVKLDFAAQVKTASQSVVLANKATQGAIKAKTETTNSPAIQKKSDAVLKRLKAINASADDPIKAYKTERAKEEKDKLGLAVPKSAKDAEVILEKLSRPFDKERNKALDKVMLDMHKAAKELKGAGLSEERKLELQAEITNLQAERLELYSDIATQKWVDIFNVVRGGGEGANAVLAHFQAIRDKIPGDDPKTRDSGLQNKVLREAAGRKENDNDYSGLPIKNREQLDGVIKNIQVQIEVVKEYQASNDPGLLPKFYAAIPGTTTYSMAYFHANTYPDGHTNRDKNMASSKQRETFFADVQKTLGMTLNADIKTVMSDSIIRTIGGSRPASKETGESGDMLKHRSMEWAASVFKNPFSILQSNMADESGGHIDMMSSPGDLKKNEILMLRVQIGGSKTITNFGKAELSK